MDLPPLFRLLFVEVPPPPLSRAPSLCPDTVCLTASASFNGIVADSNRPQPLWQPPPTACLTASGAASEVPSLPMQPRLQPLSLPPYCAPKGHRQASREGKLAEGTL